MKGNVVNYDGGTFYLVVTDTKKTSDALKFKAYIQISDAFKSAHTASISWVKKNGSTYKKSDKIKSKGAHYIVGKNLHTNSDESVTIVATIGGKKSTVTLASSSKPATPKKLSVTRNNDYRFTIKISGTGKKTIPTTHVYLQRQSDAADASWEDIANWGGTSYGSYSYTFTDQSVERGHRYRYRVRAHNSNGYSSWNTYDNGSWVYTLPPDVNDVDHERGNNNRCRVSWSKSGQELDRGLITGWVIYRSDSGAAFKKIKTVSRSDTPYRDGTVVYTDETCQPNNYYSYLIRPKNSYGESSVRYPSIEGTDPTYNTPGAPEAVRVSKMQNGNIKVSLTNKARCADTLQIAKYQNGSWTQFEDIDESGGNVTEYIDTTSTTGTGVKYRARNGRSELTGSEKYSAWKESDILPMLSKPNPPTLVEPYDNAIVTKDNDSFTVSWIHNPTDGTAQTAATVRVYKNGDLYNDYSVGNNQYKIIPLTSLNAGDVLSWKVQTKGEHADISDYSEERSIRIYEKPEVYITSPSSGSVIEDLPVHIEYTYSDQSGTLDNLLFEIRDGSETVYSSDVTNAGGSFDITDFLFENEHSYTFRITARSTTGLQDVSDVGVTMNYSLVQLSHELTVDTEIDPETGYVQLNITEAEIVPDDDPDIPTPTVIDSPVQRAVLYRTYRGKRTYIADVTDGSGLVDKFAPLNVDYSYEVLQIAASGQIAIDTEDVFIDSDYWYVYYGVNHEKIARALYNPSADISIGRPEKTQVRYSGRKYPVSYDTGAIEEKNSFTTAIRDPKELAAFIEMMREGGSGCWKSANGDVYEADFDFNYSSSHGRWWEAKLEVTRIESEVVR